MWTFVIENFKFLQDTQTVWKDQKYWFFGATNIRLHVQPPVSNQLAFVSASDVTAIPYKCSLEKHMDGTNL